MKSGLQKTSTLLVLDIIIEDISINHQMEGIFFYTFFKYSLAHFECFPEKYRHIFFEN